MSRSSSCAAPPSARARRCAGGRRPRAAARRSGPDRRRRARRRPAAVDRSRATPDRVVARAAGGHRRRRRGRRRGAPRRSRAGARQPASERARRCVGGRRVDARAPARARRARGARVRQALARGRRRRVRGDRLPRVLRARRRSSSAAVAPLLQVPGERNELRYVPRGVVAVISPWNFPLAIPCGMTAAALATGNAVVLKPAEQSPACALRLVAGAARRRRARRRRSRCSPARAMSARRSSATPTSRRSRSPARCRSAWRSFAPPPRRSPGQRHFKRVVAELGGKNCVIVDADADLDEAVPAIVASAFAYAGQKCSAAARVLVHEAIADQLLERLGRRRQVLVVGQADDARHRRAAGDRARGAGAGRPLRASSPPADGRGSSPAPRGPRRRRLVLPADASPPTCRAESPVLERGDLRPAAGDRAGPRHRAGLRRSSTGCRSRSPAGCSPAIRRPSAASATTPVGNLYVNRGITGAMVGAPAVRRQPPVGHR